MTNPLAGTQIVTVTAPFGGVLPLVLPKMNLFGSPPKGLQLLFINEANDGLGNTHAVQILAQDGSTVVATIAAPPSSGSLFNNSAIIELTNNSTQNGTLSPVLLAQIPLLSVNGGLGTSALPTAGQIAVGSGGAQSPYAPQTMSGDCVNSATLIITCGTLDGFSPTQWSNGGM